MCKRTFHFNMYMPHIPTFKRAFVHVNAPMCTHACMHMHAHSCMSVCACTYKYVTHIHVLTYVQLHVVHCANSSTQGHLRTPAYVACTHIQNGCRRIEQEVEMQCTLYNCGPPHLSWMTLEIKIYETNCTRKLKLFV